MLFDFMIMEYILNCVLLKYSILFFLFFVSSQTIEFDIIHYKLKNTLMSFLTSNLFPVFYIISEPSLLENITCAYCR